MTSLRGVGWDHPRCIGPLEAAATEWRRRGGPAIAWTFRSLDEFNDTPVEGLAGDYDLLVVDHPHVPAAVEAAALLPLDLEVGADELDELRADSLGPSFEAYVYDGRPWALPVDCACHVSAFRADLLPQVPQTWAEVLDLAGTAPGSVALSLLPADALCCLLTISAQLGEPVTAERLRFGDGAIELLAELAAVVHPCSFSHSPPELLARIAATGDVHYAPLGFGYVGFAAGSPPIAFAPPPRPDGADARGAVLGGAGLAVSSASPFPELAARFCAWLATASAQRNVVAAAGGQPASAAVWSDPEADRLAGGFFSATIAAVRGAYVRPQLPEWPQLHLVLGRELADALARRESPANVTARLDALLLTKGVTRG